MDHENAIGTTEDCCREREGAYLCTQIAGHRSPHRARGKDETILLEWDRADAAGVLPSIHGGNLLIPFYLQPGQRAPEYDQGDSVVVWYDDLYDLWLRNVTEGVASPALVREPQGTLDSTDRASRPTEAEWQDLGRADDADFSHEGGVS